MKRELYRVIGLLCLFFNAVSVAGQGSAYALDFDGTDDHLKILPRISNDPLVKTYPTHTIEAWVKSDAGEDGVVYREGWLSSSHRGQFRLYGNASGKLDLLYEPDINGVLIEVVSTTDVFDGTWHHLALVGNGNSTVLYIDGVQDATSFDYVRPSSPEQDCVGIGSQIDYGGASGSPPFADRYELPFGGQIDEVRLWSTNRSQTEIRDNMCQKVGGAESNLAYYYRFDQTSGSMATNEVSVADEATLLNFALAGTTSNWVTNWR